MAHPKRLLILFVKNPEAGQVKTRLAASLGEKQAIAIYEHLLEQSHNAAENGDWDVEVWYGNQIPERDRWSEAGWPRIEQHGADIGERMHVSFLSAFEKGYDQAVLIGSDIEGMNADFIREAFEKLSHSDSVFGPANDGGYYLVGLKKPVPSLFLDKTWSHEKVLAEAIETTGAAGFTHSLLPVLFDIDTEEDLRLSGFREKKRSPFRISLSEFLRYVLPVVVLMVVIFLLSDQDRDETLLRTGLLARICGWMGFDCAWIMQGEKAFYIRKAAHMTEYGLLAFLLLRWLRLKFSFKKAALYSLLIAVCYASTDEYHQTFVEGRGGTPVDVLIDSMGMMIGLGFGWLLFQKWKRKR
ncbi:MAG: TIGR04282 family arsenosugar biosynthesis glycosyltransferase [Bacteroidia bacterium]